MEDIRYAGLNRVLVKDLELPKTDSILASSTSTLSYGEILACGAIKEEDSIPDFMFNEGDKIYFLSRAGLVLDLPDGQFRLLNITDILIGEKNG